MRANPAGILMIGIGVVLLNLAYTGRGKAVWEALSGNYSGGKAKGQADPAPATGDNPQEPKVTSTPQGTGQAGEGPRAQLWRVLDDGAGVGWGWQ